ncbi:MAG: hypothetical protein JW870_21545 [Candidatus Delongbacteria bacterium]|nr:hypothetical protein [Candidatus Delongbacteria bacterium]
MKRIIFVLLLIIFVLDACKHNESEMEIIVNRLLSFSFEMPPSPQLSFTPIYIKQSDSIVYSATTYDLKRLYDENKYSKTISFSVFILNSFNQDMLISDTCNVLDSFKIDTKIYCEYINNNFSFITNRYTVKKNDRYYLLPSILDFEEKSTISYIFFLNNYFTLFDDVDGETSYMSFRKWLNMPPNENKE